MGSDSRMGRGVRRQADSHPPVSTTRYHRVQARTYPLFTHSHKHTRTQRAQRNLCVCMLHAVLYVLHDDAVKRLPRRVRTRHGLCKPCLDQLLHLLADIHPGVVHRGGPIEC